VESGFLLDVVVAEGSAVFKLLAGENETLLVRGDAFLVLNLGLDIVDCVAGFDLESDGLASEGLDEDLHTTTKTKDQVQSGLLLDVVIAQGAAVFELFAGEDQTLLVGRNAFLVLDLRLDVVDGIAGLNLEGDGLASDCDGDVSIKAEVAGR
jgi:hypothetical protein